jgi:hypothetical protein
MDDKYVYPNVSVKMFSIQDKAISFVLVMETWLRKKHRGKYYLQKFYNEYYIADNDNKDANIVAEINHFHSNVYKVIILGKVDLKLVFINHWGEDRNAFELDLDQTSEEERLTPKI